MNRYKQAQKNLDNFLVKDANRIAGKIAAPLAIRSPWIDLIAWTPRRKDLWWAWRKLRGINSIRAMMRYLHRINDLDDEFTAIRVHHVIVEMNKYKTYKKLLKDLPKITGDYSKPQTL